MHILIRPGGNIEPQCGCTQRQNPVRQLRSAVDREAEPRTGIICINQLHRHVLYKGGWKISSEAIIENTIMLSEITECVQMDTLKM